MEAVNSSCIEWILPSSMAPNKAANRKFSSCYQKKRNVLKKLTKIFKNCTDNPSGIIYPFSNACASLEGCFLGYLVNKTSYKPMRHSVLTIETRKGHFPPLLPIFYLNQNQISSLLFSNRVFPRSLIFALNLTEKQFRCRTEHKKAYSNKIRPR